MPPNLSFQRAAGLRLSYESIDVNDAVTMSGAPHIVYAMRCVWSACSLKQRARPDLRRQ